MDLEILVITFNRAAELDRTLTALHASPFARCRVSVLDNASTDATPEVCARWAERFPDLRVVRHRRNVGGGPNYLRAIELTRARYTWVLADDDDLDFARCGDVVAALEEGTVDLLAVGGPGHDEWPTGRTSLRRIWDRGGRVYSVLTFVPSLVFRTELFTDFDMADGYRHVDMLFPQFPFVRRQLARDATIHVAEHPIVHRGGWSVPGSHLWFFVRWVRNCHTIDDRAEVKRAIYGIEPSRTRWISVLAQGIMLERAHFPERLLGELGELRRTLVGEQKLLLLLFAPLAFGPRGAYKRLQAWNRRRAGLPGEHADSHSLEERP
jgi:glycosyltransferase involved in cell wall biosynthesis